jgi:virginiamycin B lyase
MSGRKPRRFRPGLETLEDRQLLSAAITGAITEFPLPTNGGAQGLTRGPATDNELWFTDATNNRIGRINAQGIFDTFYQVPTTSAGLGDITAGPDGNLWFFENNVGQIGRVTPAGQFTEFPLPSGYPDLNHIIAGPDGALWFTAFEINHGAGVGRIATDGTLSAFPVPGGVPQNSPSGITVGPDGAFWLTEPGNDEIVRLTTTGQVREFITGISHGASPTNITAGPDGNLWFTEPGINSIGRITPAGVVTQFDIGIRPDAVLDEITAGPDGALWFTEQGNPGNEIGRITTAGTVTEYAIPNPFPRLGSIVTGTDGNVWFIGAGGSNIDRVNLTSFESPVAFNASTYSVHEFDGALTVTVNRGGDTSGTVSVGYATGGGTAVAGVDYTATSGTLTFGPGVTSRSFTVPILNPGRTSGSVTFDLTLSNPTGEGVLATPSVAVVTITDHEPQPGQLAFSAPGYTVNESGGVFDLTVTRTNGSDGTVTVPYTVASGTAVNGVDYAAASGTLTFAPGQTSAVIPVTILDRGLIAGSTSLTLTLGAPTGGAALASPAQATLTILDNDPVRPPTSTITVLPAAIDSVTFTVSWSGAPGSPGLSIASYTIYVSADGGLSYTVWLSHTTATSATFTGQDGHRYAFYCIATDNLGDVQATPATPQAVTVIDLDPPTSSVNPLPAVINATSFPVSWSGADNPGGSGIRAFDVFVSADGGGFQPWLTGTAQTSATYTGVFGHSYAFFSVAIDAAGNRQPTPRGGQAQTTLVPLPAPRPVFARLVLVRRRLLVEVFFADTGALKEVFRSPFQRSVFRAFQVSAINSSVAGVPDMVVLTARTARHRTVTEVFTV